MSNARSSMFNSRRKVLGSLLAACCGWFIFGMGSGTTEASNIPVQQAIIITIPLLDGRPESKEIQRVYKLEDELSKAIAQSRVGEYDGSEVGTGKFTMYAYGPSADKLFGVAQPVLAKYPLPPGSRVTKRYGNPRAKEDRILIDTARQAN
jgi:hypothetical protein